VTLFSVAVVYQCGSLLEIIHAWEFVLIEQNLETVLCAQVDVSGGELIAVAKFEGYITPTAAEEVRQRLLKALERGESDSFC